MWSEPQLNGLTSRRVERLRSQPGLAVLLQGHPAGLWIHVGPPSLVRLDAGSEAVGSGLPVKLLGSLDGVATMQRFFLVQAVIASGREPQCTASRLTTTACGLREHQAGRDRTPSRTARSGKHQLFRPGDTGPSKPGDTSGQWTLKRSASMVGKAFERRSASARTGSPPHPQAGRAPAGSGTVTVRGARLRIIGLPCFRALASGSGRRRGPRAHRLRGSSSRADAVA